MNFISSEDRGEEAEPNRSDSQPGAHNGANPLDSLATPSAADAKRLLADEQITERISKTNVVVKDSQTEVHIQTRGITTIVEPGVRMTRDQFIQDKPAYSVALDGYVLAGPFRSNYTGHINFDHHFDCDRPTTDATCKQVLSAIEQGLFDESKFHLNGRPYVKAFVQDCDQDVCVSHWLLHNYDLVYQKKGPVARNIKALVELEDKLDRSGGIVRTNPKTAALQRLGWIFDPYTQARIAGKINRHMSAEDMAGIIVEVSDRITRHVYGRGEKVKLDTSYHELARGKGYMMVKENGAWARSFLFSKKVPAVVSVFFLPDGKFKYSFAHEVFSLFPLKRILDRLNQMEGLTPGKGDAWAGAKEMLAGSPAETSISPSELKQVIDDVVAEQERDHGIDLPEIEI